MVYRACGADVKVAAEMACRLWPEHAVEEMAAEFGELAYNDDAAIFIAEEAGKAVGFAQCQLRHDYVEGTETSPVGYLEGIYVDEAYRGRGIARELLEACEEWARGKGCAEFASDCEIDNTDSLKFHLKVGFKEEGRIICFAKKL